jgi:hypothetical protein
VERFLKEATMPTKLTAPSDDVIRTRAYLLWEADGGPFGQDAHYWNLASSELSAAAKPRRAAAAVAPAEKKAGVVRKAGAKPAEKAAKPKK